MEKNSLTRNSKRSYDINFAAPQGATTTILNIIHESLSRWLQQNPLETPVEEIGFSVTDTAPANNMQRHFFNNDEQIEALNSLIGRLTAKIGEQQVFRATPHANYLPEKSWQKVIANGPCTKRKQYHDNTIQNSIAKRPLRLHNPPLPLRKIDNQLMLNGRGAPKSWSIQNWHGPERLATQWWQQESPRDYYQVNTTDGNRLWVYNHIHGHALFARLV